MNTVITENTTLETQAKNSLFLNENEVELTKVDDTDFAMWLVETGNNSVNALVAIRLYLQQKLGFIVGLNKISLTVYLELRKTFKILSN